ncbi:MAG: Long-chain-fatty-acid--CoA ligase FadD17 [Candidatus Lokiarchaeum sp. GC14_75]|nr:MAG: Long-chain-fatty-acid--CoA ligase FadD17 [Candidatus Lokiarchaeum sp. GC14_75]
MSLPPKTMLMDLTLKEKEVMERYYAELERSKKDSLIGIGNLIENTSKIMPNKIGLFFEDQSWTWEQFNKESNAYANYFAKLGLNPGDVVALILENDPEYLFIGTGINKTQGISALVNTNQKKQALVHAIKTVSPRWIIVDGNGLNSLNEVIDKLPIKKSQIYVINNPQNKAHDYLNLKEELDSVSRDNPLTTKKRRMEDRSVYIYTSGTTGLPKAVILINFVGGGLFHMYAYSRISSEDIVYVTTPLYHSLATVVWIGAVHTGAAIVLRKKFSASKFWKDVHKYMITFTIYIGEIPRYLLNQPVTDFEKNHTLKKMLGVGLKKDIWLRFKSRFDIDHIFEFYGATEGFGPIFNADEIPGMVGRMNPKTHLIVKTDPESGEFYKNASGFCIKCQPGETGMLLWKIKDIGNFEKYTDKGKTEKKVVRGILEEDDAYMITGDLLTLHDNLWLSFGDRFGDTYRWKGENVSTLEVENILNSHPGIQTSAVYGVSIPNTEGKAGMVSLQLKSGSNFDIENISKFVIETLPKYSIPIFLRIRDNLALTGSLKITKTELRKEAYDISKINEPIFFWDSMKQSYTKFEASYNQKLFGGNLKI